MIRGTWAAGALSLTLLASIAQAAGGPPDLHRTVEHAVLDLWSTPAETVICLKTLDGAALNGPYGVTISPLSAAGIWSEPLPKTVSVAEDHFTLPLRVAVARQAKATRPARLHLDLGICLSSGGMCVPVGIDVTAPSPHGAAPAACP